MLPSRWMLFSVLFLVLSAHGFGADFYVSPTGDNTADGSKSSPFATLSRALKATEGQGGGTIFMQPGTYYLKQGIKIDEKLSGTEQRPLRVIAAGDAGAETVRISGGVPIDGFRPITPEEAKDLISDEAKTKVLVADLSDLDPRCLACPGDKYQVRSGPELFCNDQRMTLARWPNEGFAEIDKVIDSGRKKGKHLSGGYKSGERAGSFTIKEDRPRRWNIERGVWLGGYWCHDWFFEALRVADYNPAEKCFQMKPVHGYGIGPLGSWNKVPRRFYAENVFEELDRPGEWWIDRKAKRLYFWPPVSGKDALKNARVVLTILTEPLVKIDKAEHVTLEGLLFENGSSGVAISHANHVTLKRLTMRNLFSFGVSIENSTGSGIIDSHIYEIGSTGVKINCGDRKTLTRGDCFAVGNHIHHYARFQKTYAPGVRLDGVGNRAAKNLIHDAPHSAIIYGGNEHLIELNDIHDVALETSDVGAVYTGRDWASRGNLLRWNFIHDLPTFGSHGTTGIYLDDADSGDRLVGNIFCKIQRAIMLGGGRDNEVIGNVFVDCQKAIHYDSRLIGWAGKYFGNDTWDLEGKCKALNYKSPPWSDRYPRLARIMDEEPLLPLGNRIEDNVVVDCQKWIDWIREVEELKPRLEKGIKNNLIFKDRDPGFVDPVARDFQFKPSSPVWRELPTFKRIPVEKIGL